MSGADLPRRVPGEAPALLARNVSKVFGTARVLDDVSLSVMPAEVHGLLGANGSGKSTLIKTIAGLHAPEKGAELILYGKGVPFPMPAGGARRHGISFVHQHLTLLPSLTVLENMMLNDLATRNSWRIDWAGARRHFRQVLERFDIAIDPDTRVADLPQADRALIAITRAFEDLRVGAPEGQGILVLDEPTPFLPKAGVDRLFGLIRAVKAKGVSVILVAHDIDEIREITDRATILRDGKVAGTVVSAEASRERFMELIVGEKVVLFQTSRTLPPGRPVAARVAKLCAAPAQDISFDIHKGEILGLTGLIGSGFDTVPEALFGANPSRTGQVVLGDVTFDLAAMTPARAMQQQIVFLPADRLGRAGAGSLSIADNMSLPVLERFRGALGIDWGKVRAHCHTLGQQYDVRPNRPDLRLSSLSGGNAQKVLMAKWLQTKPRLMMLDEPTQGVDVGARQLLFKALDDAARAGTAVLVASTDPEQLAQICHRVLVFSKGRIVSELAGERITKDAISAQTLAAHPAPPQTTEAAA